MTKPSTNDQTKASRREFLQGTLATAAAAGMVVPNVHAAGSDVIKVGLVGCGGRGSGAAHDALTADPGIHLHAMGDAFQDQLDRSRANLQGVFGDKFQVSNDRAFVGFDAYKQVIDCSDVVILASPPGFRPMHLKYAVEQGKHVFAEKPVAVDGPGVRSVLETCEEAKKKGLSVVSGLCWRYHLAMRETIRRVQDGQVGKITALQCDYNTRRPRKLTPRQPGWSDMEFQMRNWYFYAWLSGDHNTEQHIHSLDKIAWVLGDQYPLKAYGFGGRAAVAEEEPGHIFDHHSVVYEYANGLRCFSNCRQQNNTAAQTEDWVYGTQGTAALVAHKITGDFPWRFNPAETKKMRMHVHEHVEMYEALRAGKTINNGEYMAKSSLMAIMGRMATYTGQVITWDQALNSKENLVPEKLDWGPLPEPPIAKPGITQFS